MRAGLYEARSLVNGRTALVLVDESAAEARRRLWRVEQRVRALARRSPALHQAMQTLFDGED
jgi:hypothetical protein